MNNKAIYVVNKNGYKLDFTASLEYMDDEIREALHSKFSPCTEQIFFTAYEIEHEQTKGVEWFLSSSNPSW